MYISSSRRSPKKFRTVLARSVVRALTVWLVSSAPTARFRAKYLGARIRLLACLERAQRAFWRPRPSLESGRQSGLYLLHFRDLRLQK